MVDIPQPQLVFPNPSIHEYTIQTATGIRIDLQSFLRNSTISSFKGFIVNHKRELVMIVLKGDILRNYLTQVGLKDEAEADEADFFFNSFIRWQVYFLDQFGEPKEQRKYDTSVDPGKFEASFYLDKETDLFYCLLPFEVDIKQELKPSCNFGVRLYYDLALFRKRVFKYEETQNFASYLLDIQMRAKQKMTDNLVYTTRTIEIKNPLTVSSTSSKSASETYLKFFIRNDLKDFIQDPTITPDSLVGSALAKNSAGQSSPPDYLSMFTQNFDAYQLKFESSMMNGQDTRIINEYIAFLDHQLINTQNSVQLLPGESITVIYKIGRRELFKFRKNKKMVYLENPLLKRMRESTGMGTSSFSGGDPLMTGQSSSDYQITSTIASHASNTGLDKDSQLSLVKSVLNLKSRFNKSKKGNLAVDEDEDKGGPFQRKKQVEEVAPPGSLEALFENYLTTFATPFSFKMTYVDGFSTDLSTEVSWQLGSKDVIIAKISLDKEEVIEGNEVEISFSFKSLFSTEILLVLNESSLQFNYSDVSNRS